MMKRRRRRAEFSAPAAEVLEERVLLTRISHASTSDIGLDIDINGQTDPLSDGILVLRWLAGFTDETLVNGVTDPSGARLAPNEIDAYLRDRVADLDIDVNDTTDPLGDGILILRHLAGFTDDALIDGVVDTAGSRTNPDLVSGHLNWLSREISVAPSFNDDNRSDIVGVLDGQLWLAESDGSQFATSTWGEWDAATDWLNVSAGDFDGDGLQDFVGRDEFGNWQVGRSDGARIQNEDWGNSSLQTFREDVLIADVNGDGRSDIVGHSNGDWSVALSTGSNFETEPWGSWPSGQYWSHVSTGDVNGDGRDDLVGYRNDGTWWSAVAEESQFSVQPWVTWPTDMELADVITGDFNGDCMVDVLGRDDGIFKVGLSTSTGGTVPVEWGRGPMDVVWEDVKVLDVNGDGRDDVAGRVAGQWWSGLSTGDAFVVEPWGPSWNQGAESVSWRDVSVADVNGDGRDDIVGRRQGQWTAAVSQGADFIMQDFGNWDRDTWNYVRPSRPNPPDDVSRQPATGFEPGVVTAEINSALVLLIDELRQELFELDTAGAELVDLSQTLDDLDALEQEIVDHQQSIQPVIDGTVDQIRHGPETVISRTTLAESDRLIWGTMLELTEQSPSGGGLETVEDVRHLAEAFYSQLVTDTINGSRDAVARLTDLLSGVSGHLSALVQGVTALTLAGISAALESGNIIINDNNATAANYDLTADILLDHVFNAELLRHQVESEIDSVIDSYFLQALELVAQVGQQLNPAQSGSAGQQIRNGFEQLQSQTGSSNSRSIYGTWVGTFGTRNSPITLVITPNGADLRSGGTIRGSGHTNQSTGPDDTILSASFSGYFTFHGCECSLDLNPMNGMGLSVELKSNGELAGSFGDTPVRFRRG